MKSKLLTAGLLIGALLFSTASYAQGRSDQPVSDSVITTKVKALYATDKDVSFRTVEVKTVNGVVHLSGTAKSKAEADKAASMARDVEGVKSVRNEIRIAAASAPAPAAEKPAKDRPATARGSDQPIDDSVITTKVKARLVKDKQVHARDIEVKTVNGVVELSGTARTRREASKAASIARNVKGVKSVKNDIQVAAASAPAPASEKAPAKDRPATAKGSDQPVADSVITTKVKALYVKDKDVSFTTVEVKTVNGVVHLGGTAKSKEEAAKAASLARDVEGVKSVKNDIRVQ
jgi:hyperosmotically inducible periplasmic protein